jgi:Isochorismatase family
MTLFRTFVLATGLVLALCGGPHAQPNGRETPANSSATGKPLLTLQMPALPDPVRVALNPATTALLVLDFVEPICNLQSKCKDGMLPAVTPFLARARQAGMVVAYGTREQNMSKWLPEVAPAPSDIKIVNTAQDRFYNTDLDKALKAKGIRQSLWPAGRSAARLPTHRWERRCMTTPSSFRLIRRRPARITRPSSVSIRY